jgi:hypothetical protein
MLSTLRAIKKNRRTKRKTKKNRILKKKENRLR